MSVENGERLATKQDLKDMYDRIRPYMGGLPEIVANKFSKGDLYSTDEKMIGQWQDGKPLYQKVVHLTNISLPSATQYSDTDLITDTSCVLINASGIMKVSGGDTQPIPCCSLNRTNGMCYYSSEIVQRASSGKITLKLINYNGGATIFSDVYAILQYTKTTDSPISIGSDTDYSTEEKIVGTWIDGSVVYQKVIDLGENKTISSPTAFNNTGGVWFDTGASSAGMSKLVSVTGMQEAGASVAIPMVLLNYNSTGHIGINNGLCRALTFRYLIVQYTKTD